MLKIWDRVNPAVSAAIRRHRTASQQLLRETNKLRTNGVHRANQVAFDHNTIANELTVPLLYRLGKMDKEAYQAWLDWRSSWVTFRRELAKLDSQLEQELAKIVGKH